MVRVHPCHRLFTAACCLKKVFALTVLRMFFALLSQNNFLFNLWCVLISMCPLTCLYFYTYVGLYLWTRKKYLKPWQLTDPPVSFRLGVTRKAYPQEFQDKDPHTTRYYQLRQLSSQAETMYHSFNSPFHSFCADKKKKKKKETEKEKKNRTLTFLELFSKSRFPCSCVGDTTCTFTQHRQGLFTFPFLKRC